MIPIRDAGQSNSAARTVWRGGEPADAGRHLRHQPGCQARKAVLHAFMISGDRGRLAEVARKEPSPELRREAINQLGVSGGRAELWQLYQQDKDLSVRRAIINALFVGGGAD